MSIIPFQDHVLISLIKEPTPLLSIGKSQEPQKGIVLHQGHGKWLQNGHYHHLGVKPGDKVLFSPYAGTPSPQNQQLLLVREDDIYGVIEE